MNNSANPVNKSTMLQIYLNGTYYNPASKHYGTSNNSVICDRCHKNGLDICIGWSSYDLCLDCVQIISDQINNENRLQRVDDRDIKTRMLQSQYKTYMMQNQFK